MTVVQQATNDAVTLAEETVEHHRTFCDKMAKTLRSAAKRPNMELVRDEDVVRAGEDVKRSFVEFSDHIGQLQDALQTLATSLQADTLTDDTQPEERKHNHHLIPHPHLRWPHLHQVGETMRRRDVIVAILSASIKVIFVVMALLVSMHPAAHHVLAVLTPLEDSVEKCLERVVHAVSECQYPFALYPLPL